MTKLQYFKFTFFSVGLGLITSLFLWNVWNLKEYTISHIWQAACKSIFTGVFTALILGLLNMFFKLIPFRKEENPEK